MKKWILLTCLFSGCEFPPPPPTQVSVVTGLGSEAIGSYEIHRISCGHLGCVAVLGSWVQANPGLKVVSTTSLTEPCGEGSSGTIAILVVAYRDSQGGKEQR